MAITKKLETVLIAGIQEYTGEKVTELEAVHDANVENTYALRAKLGSGVPPGQYITFLLVGGEVKLSQCTATKIADMLEEAQFTVWPPTV